MKHWKTSQVVAALVKRTSISATGHMIEGATHTVLQFLKDLGYTAAALHASRLSRDPRSYNLPVEAQRSHYANKFLELRVATSL
jgi:hypothetical protein